MARKKKTVEGRMNERKKFCEQSKDPERGLKQRQKTQFRWRIGDGGPRRSQIRGIKGGGESVARIDLRLEWH